jgi:aminoglycoside phosphotransferase (APT) family kinase protein
VIESVRPGPFGHEHMADRAALMLWAHQAFGRLPRHVRSLDVGAVRSGGSLEPLGDAEEFFMLAEFVEGAEYANDLLRLRDGGALTELDEARTDALSDYLVGIHRHPGSNPELYRRRVRELVGHGECIFGICDSYPERGPVAPATIQEIERRCVAWRWKIHGRSHRLRMVHGDFHPWNILFREGTDFTALDRSRGEWGDPADDVACLTLNYVFFSLQMARRLEGYFELLWHRFWDRYLEHSGDREILEVIAPYFAFRGLVMANPVWYPALDAKVRSRMLAFVLNALEEPRFDPAKVNEYCGA